MATSSKPKPGFQRGSNTLATRQIKPKSPDSFELYWTYFGYHDDSPELRRLRMRQVNLVGPGGLVSMEDGEAGRPASPAAGRIIP